MNPGHRTRRAARLSLLTALLGAAMVPGGLPVSAATGYKQTNLVSNRPSTAPNNQPNQPANQDAHLQNPWGIAWTGSNPFWTSNNHDGTSTLYTSDGSSYPSGAPLVVTIPVGSASPTGATGSPSGIVSYGGSSFIVGAMGGEMSAAFIWATEDGTISAWNLTTVPITQAVKEVDKSATGAVYKGLAIYTNSSGANLLYATNFHAGTVDVFDGSWAPKTLSGSFSDPSIPSGFAPFGIQDIGGKLYVTYAMQDSARHDDLAGPGNGYLDVFNTDGQLLRRLVTGGVLDSPWGLALATASFGDFSNDLLVGNFGNGRINAFNPATGAYAGQLQDPSGNPITLPGLWGLIFGNGGMAGDVNTLYFTAGTNGEQDGLFGSLAASAAGAVPSPSPSPGGQSPSPSPGGQTQGLPTTSAGPPLPALPWIPVPAFLGVVGVAVYFVRIRKPDTPGSRPADS